MKRIWENEAQIRAAAFRWLDEQVQIYGDVLPRTILEKGFTINSQRITLVGPSGIWKPKAFALIPLSITTVSGSPYDDSFTEDGFLSYRYRGTDPWHKDNIGLREAMSRQVPLIYFHGIVKGKYLAVWPVFVIGDNPERLTFTLAADDYDVAWLNSGSYSSKGETLINDESTYYKRSYITSAIRKRLHQKSFRERVLDAYKRQCAFCRLKHSELLDAAHIIPDTKEYGEPVVSNGLSLCKIHHAAFDSNIVGVSPEYRLIVREDVLRETDGLMLRYGIQKLHGQALILPSSKNLWPDRERLAARFEKFR